MPEEAGFEEEVRVLSKFRHPNLVILMGFARRNSQRILIYELLGGSDVQKRLERSNSEGVPFTWRERVSAAFDAACGLSHLHNSSPKVFHRDIKSPNILLDRNGTAKMADFGLACLTHGKAHKVDNAAGTVGYACPIYAKRCVVTEGSEAYSFGIVLLELLTASPPAWILRSPGGAEKYEFLAAHIKGDAEIAMSLADTGAQWPQHVGYALAELALRCTCMRDEQRPRFVSIVNALRRLRDALEACPPREPLAANHLQVAAQSPRLAEGRHQQAAARQCGTPVARAPAEMPRLWSLNCELVEGMESLDAIPPEHRTLVHRQEPGGPLLTLFKVGRRAQEDFFQAIFGDSSTRNTVSREHFQMWAVPATDGPVPKDPAAGSVPCSFFLANLSRTWTMVNDTLLDSCGKCVQLHGGDRITLGRQVATSEGVHYSTILRLSFDLTGSVLYDADVQEVLQAQPEPEAVLAALPAAPAPSPRVVTGALRGTSLVGDVEPRFLLEVGGSGVLEKMEGPHRVIAHGPPAQAGRKRTGMFTPLVLGSGHATSFWQRLLTQEALSLLAPEHVAFEAVRVQDEEPLQIAVRNCSSERPVLLRSGAEQGSLDLPHALEPSERRLLRHGDTVVLVAAQRCSVWLRFLDLVTLKPSGVVGGA